MNVRLESMCQGDGKIYAQIAIERLSADSIVTLEAHLKDGTEIPAHLLPFDPLDGQSAANFVIIVPHFDEREIMPSLVGSEMCIRDRKISRLLIPMLIFA